MVDTDVGAHAALALAVFAALCIGGSDLVHRSVGGERDPAGWMLAESLPFAAAVAPIARLGCVLTAALAAWRGGERLTRAPLGALALSVDAVAHPRWHRLPWPRSGV